MRVFRKIITWVHSLNEPSAETRLVVNDIMQEVTIAHAQFFGPKKKPYMGKLKENQKYGINWKVDLSIRGRYKISLSGPNERLIEAVGRHLEKKSYPVNTR